MPARHCASYVVICLDDMFRFEEGEASSRMTQEMYQRQNQTSKAIDFIEAIAVRKASRSKAQTASGLT